MTCQLFQSTHPSVENLLEVHSYSAAIDVQVILTIVYKSTQLLQSDLSSSISKHKQHRIYNIGLSTAIWTNNGRKTLKIKCNGRLILYLYNHDRVIDATYWGFQVLDDSLDILSLIYTRIQHVDRFL